MFEFLLWCGTASVGASLALAVVAWVGRCRCPACAPVRWRLTRPALDGAPILRRDSEAAVLASAQEAGFPPWPKEYGKGASDPIAWAAFSDPKILDALNNSPVVQYGKAWRAWRENGSVGPAPVPPKGTGRYATGGAVRPSAVGFVGNDGPEAFIPFKRHRK